MHLIRLGVCLICLPFACFAFFAALPETQRKQNETCCTLLCCAGGRRTSTNNSARVERIMQKRRVENLIKIHEVIKLLSAETGGGIQLIGVRQ